MAAMRRESRPSSPRRASTARSDPAMSSSTIRIEAESMNTAPSSITSVGTRRRGLYLAILSASPNVDQGACSKAIP
jgi:hypothetical protein